MPTVLVRLAAEEDLPAINDIYNHYVQVSTTTYDWEPKSIEDRRTWFAPREPIHPVTVAVRVIDSSPRLQPPASSLTPPASGLRPPASPILGWGSLHTFRGKIGYRHTVENSVYVHPDHQRAGIGSAILLDQIARARAAGLHAIVAGVDAVQSASLALHLKHGFREVGRFPEVGRKFDRWLDVIFLQLVLD